MIFFSSSPLLFWVRCSTISLVWYLKGGFFLPQLILSSIICIHVFFSQLYFNFIPKESLKDPILLKYQIFHKIRFLFSGRATILFVNFHLKQSLQLFFILFSIQVLRLPTIHHRVQFLVQHTVTAQNKEHLCCLCNGIYLKYFAWTRMSSAKSFCGAKVAI